MHEWSRRIKFCASPYIASRDVRAKAVLFGVTLIAPCGSDWALIEFAAQLQRSRALPLGAKLRAGTDRQHILTAVVSKVRILNSVTHWGHC